MMRLFFIDPDQARYADELELRFQVLRAPLGQTRETVRFPFERESLHLVAVDETDALVGCVLFHLESDTEGRLFQMAVATAQQRSGLGRQLVARLEEEVWSRGVARITLHARATVVRFYERLGYTTFGAPFTEVGIAHRMMEKRRG